MLALALALSLAADPECRADSDCELRRGCDCVCCPPLKAMSRAAAELDRRRCATLGDCGNDCRGACPGEAPARAECRAGRCEKVALAAGHCAADSDCVLRVGCGCECCKQERAMTQAQAQAERQRCARLGPCGQPDCDRAACPKREPSVAVCRGGTCQQAPKGR